MITAIMDYLAGEVSDQKYKPATGMTFCNIFTSAVVAKLTGNNYFSVLHLANDMIEIMENDSENWMKVSNEEAISLAAQGSLIVAGWQNPGDHGHVCIVWPSDTPAPASAKWGLSAVPWGCSVGAINVCKLGMNWIFSMPPQYFKWLGAISVS